MIALLDLETGRPLAVLDSVELTILRTAAASAGAARQFARADAKVVYGCGEQGRSHLRALALVRQIQHVYAIDVDPVRAAAFADQLSKELGVKIQPNDSPAVALAASDMCVTCTPARKPLFAGQRPGRTSDVETFVFDSTGAALQDVAAAAIAYERALQTGVGNVLNLT